jgi:hypothetical protein
MAAPMRRLNDRVREAFREWLEDAASGTPPAPVYRPIARGRSVGIRRRAAAFARACYFRETRENRTPVADHRPAVGDQDGVSLHPFRGRIARRIGVWLKARNYNVLCMVRIAHQVSRFVHAALVRKFAPVPEKSSEIPEIREFFLPRLSVSTILPAWLAPRGAFGDRPGAPRRLGGSPRPDRPQEPAAGSWRAAKLPISQARHIVDQTSRSGWRVGQRVNPAEAEPAS